MSLHISAKKSELAETVLMPGDPLRAEFIAKEFLTSAVKTNEIRGMLGFTGKYKNIPVTIQASGMGMPSMGIYSYELIHEYKVKNLIRIGTAGAFHKNINIGDIILSISTSTDSNFVHAFGLPGNFAPTASWDLILKAQKANEKLNFTLKAGNTVCCDVFYEFNDWWKPWANMGVLAVEMEAAALYMNAAYAGVNALAMMSISDHFVTGEKATAEMRQDGFTNMMELALETAIS
ncbi:MAG: purine-nucleoside phosphorylase [Eubacteriales bacterium]